MRWNIPKNYLPSVYRKINLKWPIMNKNTNLTNKIFYSTCIKYLISYK